MGIDCVMLVRITSHLPTFRYTSIVPVCIAIGNINFIQTYIRPSILCSFTKCTSHAMMTGGIDYPGFDWDLN